MSAWETNGISQQQSSPPDIANSRVQDSADALMESRPADPPSTMPQPISSEDKTQLPSSSTDNLTTTSSLNTPKPPSPSNSHPLNTGLTPDPIFQQPTSDIREPAEPANSELASEIIEEKQQQDIAADAELANGLAESDTAPIKRAISPVAQPSAGDAMDLSEPTEAEKHSGSVDLPHHPVGSNSEDTRSVALPADAPPPDAIAAEASVDPEPTLVPQMQSPAPESVPTLPVPQASSAQDDHVMSDVPPSPGKIARSRDEETPGDEPATKRMRSSDSNSEMAELKMPDQPKEPAEQAPSTSISTAEQIPASTSTAPPPASAPNKLPTPPDRTENPEHNLEMTSLQQKHLGKGLTNMKKGHHASAFNAPVDYVTLGIPTYPEVIKNPMDLKTMERKLKEKDYKTVAEYVSDFDQMVWNATKFNGPDHPVTQSAYQLRIAFDRNLSHLPPHDATEPSQAEKKAKRAAAPKPPAQRRQSRSSVGNAKSPTAGSPTQTFALGPQGVPTIRRDSTIQDGRPRREIHPPAPKDLPYSAQKPKKKKFLWELKFCREVMSDLLQNKFKALSWPFVQPVDPVALNIPSYHKVIKKPMDLSTIEKNLDSGQYENAKEFEGDVRLMFNNCYKFNPPDHAVHQTGKEFEAVFDEFWSNKKQWINEHAPSSGAQSPQSSPESDDEEEEEEAEPDDKSKNAIEDMKKQISEMQKRVEAMQKAKAAPPAPAKKGKGAKATKKETTKNAKGEKKETKQKKTKTPYVTYEQKQDISNRINTLPESRMTTALQIIRDNMPGLEVNQSLGSLT